MVDTEENEAVAYQDPLSDDSDEEPRKRILDFNGEDEGSSVDEDFVEPKSDAEPENSGSGSDEGSDAEAEKSGNDSDKQVDVDDDDDIEITVKKAEKPKEKSKDKKEKKAVIKSGIEKPKQKKDPNAPKKNLSSYIFFSNEQRLILTKKDPKLPFADVAKLLGSMWKEMTADDKKKYDDMAAKDKIRYADEMKTYVPSAASQSDQKSKPLKKQKIESSSKSADVSKSVVKSAEFIEDSDVEML